MPVSVFCDNCLKDTTQIKNWDGDWGLTYSCESCGHEETLNLKKASSAKLPWRIDWPMRWGIEGVDFEPAGKDHHSEGGSFDTAKNIAKAVYDAEPPVTFQYDFIRIKGRGGKISSSTGEVVSLADVLEIYQPEIIRYLFAGTRPNSEFAISFDLDVLKIYEDYDKCERIYFGVQEVNQKKKDKESRIYELSQVHGVPETIPYQIPLRHLCNLLQISNGDIDKVIENLEEVGEDQKERLRVRARCAWNWITQYSPEDFRFSLSDDSTPLVEVNEAERKGIQSLAKEIDQNIGSYDEKELAGQLYEIARSVEIEPKDFFLLIYKVLIGKEKGPKLANFIFSAGKEKILPILKRYQ
jgi:lysyl-tRNA synthetase class 1